MDTPDRKLGHVPGLDGIRGLAMLLVLLYHYGLFFPGWFGIQLFFVLSGFLITHRLLEAKHKPFRTYLLHFYQRRFARIFPLYYFYLSIVVLIWLISGEPARLPGDIFYLVTYLFNLTTPALSTPGYIATDLYYYLHFWSLCIEEQFYLIWPLIVFFLPLKSWRKMQFSMMGIALLFRWMIGSTALTTPDLQPQSWIIYANPLSQIDGFLLGAFLAQLHWERDDRSDWWGRVCRIVFSGPLVLLTAVLLFATGLGEPLELFDDRVRYLWMFPAIGFLSLGVMYRILQGDRWTQWLCFAPLMRIGKISYGMYVYHMVLIHYLVRWAPDSLAGRWYGAPVWIACTVLTLLLAELSFRWLEQPLLERFSPEDKKKSGRTPL